MTKMTLSEELSWRGFTYQTTLDNPDLINQRKLRFYWGVDPSAPSMQIGNLAAAMMARVFIKHGHEPVLLVGGATGMIGDPDGKAKERDLKSLDEIEKNKAGIKKQYQQVFDGLDFKVVDNYDWFKNMGYLEFLREIGKHVPLRQMINRDFVQARIGESGAGISYAEFSYSLIQGYDFLRLYEDEGVELQLAGADQWGNSIAGVDLIRRKTGGEAHVWTVPLIVNKATGKKFGKSEDGAVWLDPNLTSPYKFYQFWLNVDDEGVGDYIKVFTSLEKDEIDNIMDTFMSDRAGRLAQKRLAHEVTTIVHGAKTTKMVEKATDTLFGSANYQDLSKEEKAVLKQELVNVQLGKDTLDTLITAGIAVSRSEAMRLINSGAISVNGNKCTTDKGINEIFTKGDNLLKKGKNTFVIVER